MLVLLLDRVGLVEDDEVCSAIRGNLMALAQNHVKLVLGLIHLVGVAGLAGYRAHVLLAEQPPHPSRRGDIYGIVRVAAHSCAALFFHQPDDCKGDSLDSDRFSDRRLLIE